MMEVKMYSYINDIKESILDGLDENNSKLFECVYAVIRNPNFGKYHPIFDNPNYHILVYNEIRRVFKYLLDIMKKHDHIGLSSDYQYIIRWFYTQKFFDIGLSCNLFLDPLVPRGEGKNYGLWKYLSKYLSDEIIESVENYLLESCKCIYQKIEKFIESSSLADTVVFINNRRDKLYNLSCGGLSFDISYKYHKKLNKLYLHSSSQNINLFNCRVFNLLCRYNTLYSPGYQAMLPEQVFDLLNEKLFVKHEIFASPANCTLRCYTSAYPDTDYHFGSQGNFFENYVSLFRRGGSYELNPPFIEEHMLLMTLILIYFLDVCSNPLSFIVIIPSWTDSLVYKLLSSSKHNVIPEKEVRLDRLCHYYRNGGNYESTDDSIKNASNNSSIFILQNSLGKDVYPVTDGLLADIKLKFTS